MHVHVALIGDETDRAVGQTLGTPHILDRVAERQFEDGNQAGKFGGWLGLVLLALFGGGYLVEIDAAAGRRFERFLLVGANGGHPEIIHRVGGYTTPSHTRRRPASL